ncbi:hypothetical protein HanPI659440_Chr09g0320031 [Helianthus annuus]|nr:hypothetical protein HanPI659440_Chr09g0320031 [Helianthus annuus]
MASLLVHVVNTFGCNDYLSYVTHNTLPLLAGCDTLRTAIPHNTLIHDVSNSYIRQLCNYFISLSYEL